MLVYVMYIIYTHIYIYIYIYIERERGFSKLQRFKFKNLDSSCIFGPSTREKTLAVLRKLNLQAKNDSSFFPWK